MREEELEILYQEIKSIPVRPEERPFLEVIDKMRRWSQSVEELSFVATVLGML